MDIALIDPIELRPHDDRIAPLSDEHIDGDHTLGLIRQTDLHVIAGGISLLTRLPNRLWIAEKARRVLQAAPSLR